MQLSSLPSVFLSPLRPTDHNSIFCDVITAIQNCHHTQKAAFLKKPVYKISYKPQLEFNQGTFVCPQGEFLWIPVVHSDLHTPQPLAGAGRGWEKLRVCLYQPRCHSDPTTELSHLRKGEVKRKKLKTQIWQCRRQREKQGFSSNFPQCQWHSQYRGKPTKHFSF